MSFDTSTSTPLAYASRATLITRVNAPVTRLAVLMAGAVIFMALAGCFCVGMIRVHNLPELTPWMSNAEVTARIAASASKVPMMFALIASMAIACFATSIGFVVAIFRYDRAPSPIDGRD